ncbi:polynucleotide kinase 3 phosphatase-domain-containing protein [Kockiozyma suomiensis]|uniref:polynucleotide kinase 3 phosphatase-domain-containing protein n=1 Tax=Kockiozyma suomiensis TaxID=1337062 RepID=UPI0033434010
MRFGLRQAVVNLRAADYKLRKMTRQSSLAAFSNTKPSDQESKPAHKKRRLSTSTSIQVDSKRTHTASATDSSRKTVLEESDVFERETKAEVKSGQEIEWVTHASSVLMGSYIHAPPNLSHLPSAISSVHIGKEEKQRNVKKVVVAGFDLDGTVIVTTSGFAFARNEKDWKFQFGERETIDKFHSFLSKDTSGEEERVIVIFSNQNGIALNPKTVKKDVTKTRIWQFKTKLHEITGRLAKDHVLPFYIVAATGKDEYRKPQTGMWELVRECLAKNLQLNDKKITIELDKQKSFFVGDAAGRKGDHSAVDKDFAKNLGVKFFTPEEYFGG